MARKAPLFKLIKKKHLDMDNIVTFKALSKFFKDYFFEDFDSEFLNDDPDVDEIVAFLVCLLTSIISIFDGLFLFSNLVFFFMKKKTYTTNSSSTADCRLKRFLNSCQ